MMKLGLRLGVAGVCLALPSLLAADARACGGCFHPEDLPGRQNSVVTAHRMALSVSPDASVLWDQVQYAGSPAEFAWVLPVKPGARLEVSSDAWFEALDAATAVRVLPPALQCVTQTPPTTSLFWRETEGERYPSCQLAGPIAAGCASDEPGAEGEWEEMITPGATQITDLVPPEEPVTVVHQGSVGPYETVTLHSDVPGALTTWLEDNAFAIDPDIQPIIDAYAAEGFDFIALRLLPDAGVQQMRPVRVVQPGAVTTLPLRMVAAGTGANVSMTLFVIGEGRWGVKGPAVERPAAITWDFAQQASDYAPLREELLASQGGLAWLTAYARPGALLSPLAAPDGSTVQYAAGFRFAFTVADAFMDQAFANGEAEMSCAGIFAGLAGSLGRVVDPCDAGGNCAELGPDEIDARYFACGPLDDLAVALTGLHPADVWVTRLEAELPREALGSDLVLEPAAQEPLTNMVVAAEHLNPPCDTAGAAAPRRGGGASPGRHGLATLLAAALAAVMARRLHRARVGPAWRREAILRR